MTRALVLSQSAWWRACSPTLTRLAMPRRWPARQRYDARIGLEYLRYGRRLDAGDLLSCVFTFVRTGLLA